MSEFNLINERFTSECGWDVIQTEKVKEFIKILQKGIEDLKVYRKDVNACNSYKFGLDFAINYFESKINVHAGDKLVEAKGE